MITNLLLGTIIIALTIILFLKIHISEDKRYDIYTRMEKEIEEKLNNKSGIGKFFYVIIFHVF